MNTDENIILAMVIKDLGLLGLAALIALNASGLAMIYGTAGPADAATDFLIGVVLALIGVLVAYWQAQMQAIGRGFSRLSTALAAQMLPPLGAAVAFVFGVIAAITTLS